MIQCSGCGFDASPDFAFCPKCGRRLAAAATAPPSPSPAAQAPAPVDTAGEPAAAAAEAPASERRPVSVLFADISGFTALSERLDPEDVAALVDRCLRAMADAVYRYEGTVDKYIGDCLMAVFGAPLAHEDDPERAIRAALDMRDRIGAIEAELDGACRGARAAGEPVLSLHTGVSSGLVVAGAVGSDRQRAYTVLGDTVNVAARLEAAAGSGEVVAGPETYRLTRHAFAFEPLGGLALKGKTEPLPAYRVRHALAAPRSARGLEAHGLAAPLVGREEELERLLAAIEEMRRGEALVISLGGEAGAGKSRLLRELFRRLESEEWTASGAVRVLRAACSAIGQQPYGVLAAVLRSAHEIGADAPPAEVQRQLTAGLEALGAPAEEVERVVPLFAHLLGAGAADSPLQHVEPEQLKRQLFRASRQFCELQLARAPLLLAVDDAHWIDGASLELLRFLLDSLGDRSLALLLAHRPTFAADTLAGDRVAPTAIRLDPLSAGESTALLEGIFGPSAGSFPARLRSLLVARTGGNPFYLEEVVRGLIEGGVLRREGDGWICAADVAALDVPPTVQGVLLARLDHLPTAVRRLAQEAAVLGATFDEGLLRDVGSEPARVPAHLAALQAAELIEATTVAGGSSGADYRFCHALMQEVAYASLLVRRRAELHGRAGAALERRSGGRPERLETLEALGHHFSRSAEKVKGARYLRAAGDAARAIYANEDAARYYQRAWETLQACDAAATRDDRLAVRERLGDALALAGRRQEALGHYHALLGAYAEDGERSGQARLRRKIAGLCWDAGDREGALAHYHAGLALLDGEPEHIERAHLLQELGRLAFRSGDNEQAIRRAEEAVQLAERLAATAGSDAGGKDASAVIAHAYNTMGAALARTGQLQEALAYVERSVGVAQEHDLLQVACRAFTNLGVLYTALDPGQAIETCLAGLELAKKIGHLGLQSWLYANLAGAYCTFTGQCEAEGIAAAQAAIELDRQLGQLDHLAVPLIVLGQIYQCHGEPELSFQCYQEALALAQQMGEPQLLFPCYDGLATLCLELGEEAQAERYLAQGQEVCRQAGVEMDALVLLPFLC